MFRTRVLPAALGLIIVSSSVSAAVLVEEDFSTNPATRGWQAAGESSLFAWNAAAQKMAATWDSSKTNSYYHLPLGATLTKSSEFSIEFDLELSSFACGLNWPKTNNFQVAIALINLNAASQPGFIRGSGYEAPHVVEFNFFPDPGGSWIWGPSVTSVMIDQTGSGWSSGGFGAFGLESNLVYHVRMDYNSAEQRLRTTVLTNGANAGVVGDATLAGGWQAFTDFAVDHLAICSYSDAGQLPEYAGSVLAHGQVDNFRVTSAPRLTGSRNGNTWEVQTVGYTGWTYILERSTNLTSWSEVRRLPGQQGQTLTLTDPAPPSSGAIYRVISTKP